MSFHLFGRLLLPVVLAALVVPSLAAAQEGPAQEPDPPGRDVLARMIGDALPPVIQDDNTELVERLMRPRFGAPISKSFQSYKALLATFGRARPSFSPDCRQILTPVGEPDDGVCTAFRGDPAGRGQYSELQFSKQFGRGNVRMMRRPEEAEIDPDTLQPVRMEDGEAYQKAVAFLTEHFGLPEVEVPTPPAGASLPVRDLVLGWADKSGNARSVAIQKVVSLRRGLLVDLQELPWVPAPGDAIVRMDDQQVWQASIRNWQDLKPHPAVDPRNAKTKSDLIAEIAEDLAARNTGPIARISMQVVLDAIRVPSHGLMLPAVQIWVSPVSRDASEEEQAGRATSAGYVEQYQLVRLEELDPEGDE